MPASSLTRALAEGVHLHRAVAAFSAAALLAACSTSESTDRVLELQPYVGRLLTLEHRDGAPLLFDTGAGVTALTPDRAAELGCVPFGRHVGFRMSGERVEFLRCGAGAVRLSGMDAGSELFVFDLMALLPVGLPPLGGIVSLASFANHPLTVDLANKRLFVESESSLAQRVKGAREGVMRLKRGPGDELTVFVKVAAQTGDLWFLLDSANLDNVMVSSAAAEQLPAAIGGEPVDLDIDIAGVGAVVAQVRKGDIIYDGVLNEEVMRRFVISMDFRRNRIWFQRHDGTK